MSVVTRTNRVTNPKCGTNATNYSAVAGTGGTATGARNTSSPYAGAGFYRVSWTGGTTAVSGGASYLQTGLSASTQYSTAVVVRCSKTQNITLGLQFQDNTSTNVGPQYVSAGVALAANVWSDPIPINGPTSGAGVDRVVLQAVATSGFGVNWANGDTLDVGFLFLETGATVGAVFDGSYVNANSVMYAWSGAADASTSTATTYTPAISLVTKPTFDPCPRVEITISDATPTDNVVNVWRTADGKRQAVRGARKWTVNGSNFVIDYEPALGQVIAYDLEVTSGLNNGVGVTQQTTTVNATSGCIQDPLVPSSAIPIYGDIGPNGEPALRGQALQDFEYAAGVTMVEILGSPDPVALIGQRLSAGNVDFSVVTAAAQQTTNLRNLLMQAGVLLVRPVAPWDTELPGLCYIAAKSAIEQPFNTKWGGSVTNWAIKSPLVAAPTMNVLVPVWTWGAVAALWGTYQAAQTALASKTYLDVLKSPSGV